MVPYQKGITHTVCGRKDAWSLGLYFRDGLLTSMVSLSNIQESDPSKEYKYLEIIQASHLSSPPLWLAFASCSRAANEFVFSDV